MSPGATAPAPKSAPPVSGSATQAFTINLLLSPPKTHSITNVTHGPSTPSGAKLFISQVYSPPAAATGFKPHAARSLSAILAPAQTTAIPKWSDILNWTLDSAKHRMDCAMESLHICFLLTREIYHSRNREIDYCVTREIDSSISQSTKSITLSLEKSTTESLEKSTTASLKQSTTVSLQKSITLSFKRSTTLSCIQASCVLYQSIKISVTINGSISQSINDSFTTFYVNASPITLSTHHLQNIYHIIFHDQWFNQSVHQGPFHITLRESPVIHEIDQSKKSITLSIHLSSAVC